ISWLYDGGKKQLSCGVRTPQPGTRIAAQAPLRIHEIEKRGSGLRFSLCRPQIRLMHPRLRFEYRHRRIDPHLDERGVLAFVCANPNAIQAGARHGILTVENEIEHDALL